MTTVISILLYSISANIDNLIIFTSLSFQGRRMTWYHFFIISIISSTITFMTMKYALYLTTVINMNITNLLGAIILLILGIILIISFFVKKDNSKNYQIQLNMNYTFTLAFGLSINNVPTAISASLIGLPVITSTFVIFIISMLFLYLGQLLGNKHLTSVFGKYVPIIAGILLIVLSLLQIVF